MWASGTRVSGTLIRSVLPDINNRHCYAPVVDPVPNTVQILFFPCGISLIINPPTHPLQSPPKTGAMHAAHLPGCADRAPSQLERELVASALSLQVGGYLDSYQVLSFARSLLASQGQDGDPAPPRRAQAKLIFKVLKSTPILPPCPLHPREMAAQFIEASLLEASHMGFDS